MANRPSIPVRHPACVLLSCLVALGASACGGEEGDDGASRSSAAAEDARAVERAFLTTMVPHHESAIAMAQIAKEQGKDPFVTKLAEDIARTQKTEIARMRKIHRRLLGVALEPDPAGHDRLGLTAAEAGMTHDAQSNAALRAAEPFDRAFVDQMVPHHEGAIRMANVVLESTKDAELRRLAAGIVATQKHEIERMNSFRNKRFDGAAPDSGGHDGH